MKKIILIFGALALCILILFRLSSYIVVSEKLEIEFIIAGIAIVFLVIGILLNKRSLQKKQSTTSGFIDEHKIEVLGISKREYEILLKISEGYSNKEIGEALFVSENTVKSHVSNLFVKLDVKRRTQALQRAKELNIIL